MNSSKQNISFYHKTILYSFILLYKVCLSIFKILAAFVLFPFTLFNVYIKTHVGKHSPSCQYLIRLHDDDTETIYDYIKHIEYMVNLVGYDHVSFGFDFNMYLGDFGVKGLESPKKIKDVIQLLLERNHKLENVKKIAGGNLIRVLYEIL